MTDSGMCTARQYRGVNADHVVPEFPAKEVLWEGKISD